MQRVHPESEVEENESEEEMEANEEDETNNSDSEGGEYSEDEGENGFDRIIEEAKVELQDELENKPEENEEKIKSRFQKIFREKYKDTILWMRILKKDPTHLKVMETAKNLRDIEDYDYEDSIESAIMLRKHLLNRLVPHFQELE